MTSNTRSALSLRKRDNNSCKLICLSSVSFFKRPFLYRPYFSMTRSRMASRIPLLCVSAIENVAENDFDRGGGSDNFFEILFMQKTKSKTDVLPSLMSFWVTVWTRAVVCTRALPLPRRCVRGRHRAGKGERWIKFQSHLRKVCPTDDAGFVRMSLKTLAMWLMDMSRTRSPHCRLYHIPLKVDGRRTVGSF